MINTQRIVPIQKVDFLTLIGTVMTLANVSYSVLASSDIDGDFTVTGSGSVGNLLANQPVESINFADGVTGATVYFVPAYDYTGIYDELHLAQQNNTIKELGSLWKTELGIKISPINAFLKNEANAWLSQKLAQIQTQIDELPQNINVYQLNIDYDGVRKVIQRYELNSLNSLI